MQMRRLCFVALIAVVWVSQFPSELFAQSGSRNTYIPAPRIQSVGPSNQAAGLQTTKVVKTQQQWRQQLTAEEFNVTRQKGTEQAYTGKYWNQKQDGIYTCKCCGQALFDAKTKFESGTGWPSYFQAIAPGAVNNVADFAGGMQRTEVTCSRCDAHLGHVFNDGPRPTGLRYCMNSVALGFANRAAAGQQANRPAAIVGAQPAGSNVIVGGEGYASAQKLVEAFSIAVAENSKEKFLKCTCLSRLPADVSARLKSAQTQLPSGVASMALSSTKPPLKQEFEYNIQVAGSIELSFQAHKRKSSVAYGQYNGRYFLANGILKGSSK